jgi:hypothetical protein
MAIDAAPGPLEGQGPGSGGASRDPCVGRQCAPAFRFGAVRGPQGREGHLVFVGARAEILELPDDGVEFVRFCRARRRVAWPELYDEMCDVARRRLFRGWGLDELAEHGVEFGLFQMTALAATTRRVIAEEAEARCTTADGTPILGTAQGPAGASAA